MSQAEQFAEHLLTLSQLSWIAMSRDTADLSESEFLALDYLAGVGTTHVGEIHRHIGVLPAQMSRLLRRLESGGWVTTAINAADKRKVDVTLTSAGRQMRDRYRQARLAPLQAAMTRLTPEEQVQFMALVDKMTEA